MLKQKPIAKILLIALVAAPLILLAAMNTSGSIVTSIFREGRVPLKGVWVRLAKASGGHELTHVVQQGRVTVTDNSGNFSFVDVAPGEYILTFSGSELKPDTRSDGNLTQRSKLDNSVNQMNDSSRLDKKIDSMETSLDTARISVTGAAGGPIEEDWAVKVKAVAASSQRTSNRFDPLVLDMSSDSLKRPGKAKYKNIVLRVDGTSAKHLTGQVSVLK